MCLTKPFVLLIVSQTERRCALTPGEGEKQDTEPKHEEGGTFRVPFICEQSEDTEGEHAYVHVVGWGRTTRRTVDVEGYA